MGLNDFAASGGLVLKTADTKVAVKGVIDLGVTPVMPDAAIIAKLSAEAKYKELEPYTTVGKHIAAAEPLAKAIGEQLHKADIKPVFDCDQPGIVGTRQASGDVGWSGQTHRLLSRLADGEGGRHLERGRTPA